MSDFESRLRDALSATASSVDAVPPPAEPMLAAADARRERRRSLGGAGAGLVVLVLVTVALVASTGGGAGRRGSGESPAPTEARLASRDEVTTVPAPLRPTTTVRRAPAAGGRRPTSVTSAPSSVTPTSAPVDGVVATTSTTADVRPLAQRVPAGVWIVGLDGSRLRRIADGGRWVWSPDGTMLGVAGDRITMLSAGDGHEVATVEAGPKGTTVGCLDWATTGTLGWVTTDGRLRFARMEDRAASVDVAARPVQDGGLDAGCAWSPDGAMFATAGDGFAVYDASGGRRVVVPSDPQAATVTHPKWSPDGRTLAGLAFDRDGRSTGVSVLTLGDEPSVRVVNVPDEVERVVWSADGRRVLVRGAQRLSAVDPVSGEVTVASNDSGLAALTPLRDGNYLSAGSGSSIRFASAAFDPLGTLLTAAPATSTCDTTQFFSVRVAPGGREVAVEARCDKQRPR